MFILTIKSDVLVLFKILVYGVIGVYKKKQKKVNCRKVGLYIVSRMWVIWDGGKMFLSAVHCTAIASKPAQLAS